MSDQLPFSDLLRRVVFAVCGLLVVSLGGSYWAAGGEISDRLADLADFIDPMELGGPRPELASDSAGSPGSRWADVAAALRGAVAFVEVADGTGPVGRGSAVVIHSDGLLITNWHVVEDAFRVRVGFGPETSLDATVIGHDAGVDLAVLRVEEPFPWAVAALGDSDGLRVGEWVLAMGAPFGLTETVSAGIISARNRRVSQLSRRSSFIQTDAAINPGNSGGALVNLRGEVVGINTAIAVSEEAAAAGTGTYAGVGFALPMNTVVRVAARIIRSAGLELTPSDGATIAATSRS